MVTVFRFVKLLAEQYARQNPPPDEPEAYQSWKYTRDYYIDSAVMRERVLVAVTGAYCFSVFSEH